MPIESMWYIAWAQPFLGAFIGYLTNKIAIRMLFRPLRPWYVLGKKVPLTPGVIPAKRQALAASIGEMVGTHLLTSRELGAAISDESFQVYLANLLQKQLATLAAQEQLAPVDLFTSLSGADREARAAELAGKLAELLHGFLASESLVLSPTPLPWQGEGEANYFLESGKGSVFVKEFGEVILTSRLNRSASGLADLLAAMLHDAGKKGQSLQDLLPPDLLSLLHTLIQDQTAPILSRVAEQLLAPENRQSLLKSLLAVVYQLLDTLGPMGAMARGLFEPEAFSRKVSEYLDKNRTQIEAWITSVAMQERLALVLKESVDSLLAKEMTDMLAAAGPEGVNALCQSVASHLFNFVNTDEARVHLLAVLGKALVQILQGEGQGSVQLLSLLRASLQTAQGKAVFLSLAKNLIRQLLIIPMSRYLGQIPVQVRSDLATGLAVFVNAMLVRELPGLLAHVNIQDIVTRKVDSLDLLQLERLLLGIMEEQFKYINLFGALLGFLIGLINVVILSLG